MLLLLIACQQGPDGREPVETGDDPVLIPGDTDAGATVIPGDTSPDTGEDPDPDDEVDAAYAAFFDPTVIQEVHIELEESAMRALERDPTTYVEGAAEVNGEAWAVVGVRLKGSSTYQTFSGKPSLKLKLNEFVPGQAYAGLERITLNNMISDPTQSKEVTSYHLYELTGMTGPKANYARVWVNDEYYGLYTNLESMDDHWLARRYLSSAGDFWGTASSAADFDRANVRCDWCYWVLKSGDGDVTKLLAVKEAIDDAGDDFVSSLDGVIDAEQYLDYWAWNTVLGNGDGYPWTTNDVFIYADPNDSGRFDFSPWGMDESLNAGAYWSASGTRLGNVCTGSSSCQAEMKERICANVATWETFDAAEFAAAAWALSEAAMTEDTRRPYTVADVALGRSELGTLIGGWPAVVRVNAGCDL